MNKIDISKPFVDILTPVFTTLIFAGAMVLFSNKVVEIIENIKEAD